MKLLKVLKSSFPPEIRQKLLHFLSKISSNLNGPFVDSLLVKSGEYKFLVAVNDMSVGKSLRQRGSYGKDELKIISKLVNTESTVIFIGAHIGALAIPTAKKVKEAIFVEANPMTFEYLSTNIFLNNLKNTVSYNIAVGEKDGKINFVMNTVNSGGSKREPLIKKSMYYYDAPITVNVPMVSFDNLLDHKSRVYDLVFMDIEGSEFFALKGMPKTLRKTKALIVEFIPHHLRNVSNVSVKKFLAEIEPFFRYCFVPSKETYLTKKDFLNFFEEMFIKDQTDDGLVFTTEYVKF